MEQCLICQGSGLEEKEPQKCPDTDIEYKCKGCYKCNNGWKSFKWNTCKKCQGSGEKSN